MGAIQITQPEGNASTLLHPATTLPRDSVSDSYNEVTFVAGLASQVRVWAGRPSAEQKTIADGAIEHKQLDPNTGTYKRCDMRLVSAAGRRLASGEFKRPEVPEGRDPRSESLVADARQKAIWGGVEHFFTCNMTRIVLYRLGRNAGDPDEEVREFKLAEISKSSQVPDAIDEIHDRWEDFLDHLDGILRSEQDSAPQATAVDVLRIRSALDKVVEEALPRADRLLTSDPSLTDSVREDAALKFAFRPALDHRYRADFLGEVRQLLRLAAFVVAQKALLYRSLSETGPKRDEPFSLDPLAMTPTSTDTEAIKQSLSTAWAHAITRSGDFESAFSPKPLQEILFVQPIGNPEVQQCQVGEVWNELMEAVNAVSWGSVERNLVGLLYEMIVDPVFRHELGQYYTREDVVDLLTTFAVREPSDIVLDPAAGGGSFLTAAYQRKRDLGEEHDNSLARVWGIERTAFAAELSTVSLAVADAKAAAAYPRVALADFFDIRPGHSVPLDIPDEEGLAIAPTNVDAVIGNPPYISYRRIDNQDKIVNALAAAPKEISLPRFSGKSDIFSYFIAHATTFLRDGGRLSFVVSSSILFTDYSIPLIQFIGKHYKIRAICDSMAERWFPDADTNAVLLFLERESDGEARELNTTRFIRFRRRLHRLVPSPHGTDRRDEVEQLIDALLNADESDARFSVRQVQQGPHGGLKPMIKAAAE